MAQVQTFKGIAKSDRTGWWAYCLEMPVSAHGADYNEAVQGMIQAIRQYHGSLNGVRPKAPMKLPNREGSSPFTVTVDLS